MTNETRPNVYYRGNPFFKSEASLTLRILDLICSIPTPSTGTCTLALSLLKGRIIITVRREDVWPVRLVFQARFLASISKFCEVSICSYFGLYRYEVVFLLCLEEALVR